VSVTEFLNQENIEVEEDEKEIVSWQDYNDVVNL
jgi:hypothetical protein